MPSDPRCHNVSIVAKYDSKVTSSTAHETRKSTGNPMLCERSSPRHSRYTSNPPSSTARLSTDPRLNVGPSATFQPAASRSSDSRPQSTQNVSNLLPNSRSTITCEGSG